MSEFKATMSGHSMTRDGGIRGTIMLRDSTEVLIFSDTLILTKEKERQRFLSKCAAQTNGQFSEDDLNNQLMALLAQAEEALAADPNPYAQAQPPEVTEIRGNYAIVDGHFAAVKSKETQAGVITIYEPLGNFVARAGEELVIDDGIEERRLFVISGSLDNGMTLPHLRVEAKQFASMSWTLEWGMKPRVRAGMRRKDEVREAIQVFSEEVKQRRIYAHTGMRKIESSWTFLHDGGAIGADNIDVELPTELRRYCLPGHTDNPQQAMSISLQLLDIAPRRVTIPLWASMYLAPLAEALQIDFSLWLLGVTGVMKSTIAALFLAHYGPFSRLKLSENWSSTDNRLEKHAFLAKDVPLVIDDFAPASSVGEAIVAERKAQRLLRAQGNHAGRGRLRSDTSDRLTYYPRGLLVATGEQAPSGQSILARVLTLEIGSGEVHLDHLTDAQSHAERLPHAMRGFIEHQLPQMDDLQAELPERWKTTRAKAMQVGQHLRQPEIIAHLYIGLELALDYAVHVGALTDEQRQALLQEGWGIFLTLIAEQSDRVGNERPVQRYLDVIRSLLDQKRVYLKVKDGAKLPHLGAIGWEEDEDGVPEPKAGAELLGWADNDWIYLLPEVTYNRVARFCRAEGSHFPVKSNTLNKHLQDEELIKVERDSRGHTNRLVRETIEGRQRRVLKLRSTALLDET